MAFLTKKRNLVYLRDISTCVAKRSFERSKSLYKELGLSPDAKDFSPEGLDVNSRSAKASYLKKRVEQLCESEEISL